MHYMTSQPLSNLQASASRPWSGRTIKIKIALLCVLALLQIVVTFTVTAPGHLLPDEAIYHWMVKSFAQTGRLDIWNGYDEVASPELHHPLLVLHQGKLYPQYPFLFQLLAAPFYLAAGFLGVFALNSVCFIIGTVLWLFAARRLFGDEDLALNSVLIFVLATFAWEYSQAAWPHAASLSFVAGAFYCLVRSFYADSTWQQRTFAALSGLIAGFATGMRLDAFLMFPGIILPFLFARPWRPIDAVAAGLGLLPGLALLAGTNFLKFGAMSPVSYGGGGGTPTTPLVLPAVVAALLVAIAWTLTRPRCAQFLSRHGLAVVLAFVGCAFAAIMAVPKILVYLERFLDNAYVLLVDIRSFPSSEVVVGRSAGGGVVYGGALKKSLLQSLPFLPLLIVSAAAWMRGKDRSRLALLLPIPICVTAFYSFSYLELHGGFCLNQRYLLYCLPFISMLCAYGMQEINEMRGRPLGFSAALAVGLLTIGAYLSMTRSLYSSVDGLEFPLLLIPLWIAGILLGLLVIVMCRLPAPIDRLVRTAAGAVIVVALTWSSLVALTYDYPHHRRVRAIHYSVGQRLIEAVPQNSILFSDNKTYAASMEVMEKKGVRLAAANLDGFGDMPRLIDFHLSAGRRAFALLHRSTWERLQSGSLKPYAVKTVIDYSTFSLREIGKNPNGS